MRTTPGSARTNCTSHRGRDPLARAVEIIQWSAVNESISHPLRRNLSQSRRSAMSTHANPPAGNRRPRQWWMAVMTAMLCFLSQSVFSQADDGAASLRDKYQSLTQQLAQNQFERPLYLESQELPSALNGNIYGVVNYPFAMVNATLNHPTQGPANWCDVLILHLNIKYCHASTSASGTVLAVNIGKKTEESLSSSYRVQFNYHPAASTPDYFRVELSAATGPLSTKDYRIVLEAIPVDDSRT